jgi:lysyl-tRNA synthetase class 2
VTVNWRPSASRDTLALRADLLERARHFFSERGVLEVETPVLARAGTTDPTLSSFVTRDGASRAFYLQTSPEHAMKRLLAAGSGSIYQLSRVFRRGEQGLRHNPEFSLLEWYRPGLSYIELMDEVAALVAGLLPKKLLRHELIRSSWNELFIRHLGIDALTSERQDLVRCAAEQGIETAFDATATTSEAYLDLLMSHVIEPRLPRDRLVFVYHYPASQAAMAQLEPADPRVARRFELIVNGVELANGFQELGDAGEQRCRMAAECAQRRRRNLPAVPADDHLLSALEAGLPDCSGVALGFDRLVMLAAGLGSMDQTLAFSWSRV